MGDMSDVYASQRERQKDWRQGNLEAFEPTSRWTEHTSHHYSTVVCGYRLDYWPSTKKFRYRDKVERAYKIESLIAWMEGKTNGKNE